MTLACEDGNSKLVEVVTVVKRLLRLLLLHDIDAYKRFDDSLVQIWKLKFGHKIKFLSTLWFGQAFKLKLRGDLEAEV